MSPPPTSWPTTQLLLAEQVLAITREITALRHRVRTLERQSTTGMDLRRVIGLLRAWAQFLASPKGQALLAIISPLLAALARWLVGGS